MRQFHCGMDSLGKKGFTIVELLVVISVVALLMALLLPSLSMARKTAEVTICASQMRQNGVALNAYASDYLSYYPLFGGVPYDMGGGRTGGLQGGFQYDVPVFNAYGSYLNLANDGLHTPMNSTAKMKYCPVQNWLIFSTYTFCNPNFTDYGGGIPAYTYFTGRTIYGGTGFWYNTINRRNDPKEILMTDQLYFNNAENNNFPIQQTHISSAFPWFNAHDDRSSQMIRRGRANHLTADGRVVNLDFSQGSLGNLCSYEAGAMFTGVMTGPQASVSDGPYPTVE